MYRDKVIKWYQGHLVRRQDIDGELRAALKSHERLPLFLENLIEEFNKVKKLRAKQGKWPLRDKILKDYTDEMIGVFINNVKKMADSKAASDIARVQAEYAAKQQEDLEKTVNGKPSGDYEALEKEGIIFDNSRPDEEV